MSHASAIDKPAPAAASSTAAITGLLQLRIERIRPCRRSIPARRSIEVIARRCANRFRSPLTQKTLPTPVRTIASMSGYETFAARIAPGLPT